MTKLLLAILFLSAAGSCDAAYKNWTEKERKLYHSYIALSAVDTYQAFKMIDCQMKTNHLVNFGAEEMPRDQFVQLLSEYIKI